MVEVGRQVAASVRGGDGRVDVDAQALSTSLGGHVGAVRLLLHQGRVIRCRKGEGTFACNPEYAILVVPSSSPSSSAPDLLMRSANEMNNYDTARNKKRKHMEMYHMEIVKFIYQ